MPKFDTKVLKFPKSPNNSPQQKRTNTFLIGRIQQMVQIAHTLSNLISRLVMRDQIIQFLTPRDTF